jgi:D-alanine-D-alanine ligase-like ATP-grasp enzyme
MPEYEDCQTILNKPEAVAYASDKITFFRRIKEHNEAQQFFYIPIPMWASIKEEAKTFTYPIFCRTKAQAYGGEGIVVAKKEDELVDAPLYTEGIPHAREYRFHVSRHHTVFSREFGMLEYDKCFFLQQKKRRQGQRVDGIIKNKASGWVFCHKNITPIEDILYKKISDTCDYVLDLFGLDFGAFDVLIKNGEFWILEVNTAPGFDEDSTTCVKYEGMLYRATHNFPYPCLGGGGG